MFRGYGLSMGAMFGCVLCGVLLSPIVTLSQASTTSAGRCFDYDDAGRLNGVRNELGAAHNYGLDPASNRKSVSAGSGSACTGSGVPAPSVGGSPPPSPPPPGSPPPPPSSGNRPPVAVDEAFQTRAFSNVTQSVMVLQNDSDPDGDDLEIVDAMYSSAFVTVTKLALPNSGGRLKYLDIVGVSPGETVVEYIVSDGQGGTATGRVYVTVTSPSPDEENPITTLE